MLFLCEFKDFKFSIIIPLEASLQGVKRRGNPQLTEPLFKLGIAIR